MTRRLKEAGKEAGKKRAKAVEKPKIEVDEGAGEGVGEGVDGVEEGVEEKAGEGLGEEVEEQEDEEEENLPPISTLEGLCVNKAGKIIDRQGTVVGELVDGDAKKISKLGLTCDADGQLWDQKGHIIGRAKTIPIVEGEEEPPFAGLEGLIVTKDGYVEDENGNRVGKVVQGDAKRLVGRIVDEDGDILDKKGSVVGHVERYEEEEPVPEPEAEPQDLSILAGRTVNKQGNVIGPDGVPIGRLVKGNAKQLAGKKVDGKGQIWNESGKVIGQVELIPEEEREEKPEGPFSGLESLRVIAGGKVADGGGNVVGEIVEGNARRLVGMSVDEDGDIIDRFGSVKGHAEPLPEAEEEAPPDLSILDGKTVNKQGFVVGSDGVPLGRLVEGDPKLLAGRKSDGHGLIYGDTGKVVGKAILLPDNERVSRPEGPFSGLSGLKVFRDGMVKDSDGNIVGIVTSGDPKRLMGQMVDEDGDIIDKFGNVKGHAEPYEEEELESEEEEELEPPETEEEKRRREDDELADKMAAICQRTLEDVQPVMKQITDVCLVPFTRILGHDRADAFVDLLPANREGRSYTARRARRGGARRSRQASH